jgi:hypothetical protein
MLHMSVSWMPATWCWSGKTSGDITHSWHCLSLSQTLPWCICSGTTATSVNRTPLPDIHPKVHICPSLLLLSKGIPEAYLLYSHQSLARSQLPEDSGCGVFWLPVSLCFDKKDGRMDKPENQRPPSGFSLRLLTALIMAPMVISYTQYTKLPNKTIICCMNYTAFIKGEIQGPASFHIPLCVTLISLLRQSVSNHP